MKGARVWINLSILNLCTVAFLGLTLRSKIRFELPFINFTNLLQAHSHFAFDGWVTFTLVFLMVNELLSDGLKRRFIYSFILPAIALDAWIMLFTFTVSGNSFLSNFFATLFILITYVFSWRFIKDIRQAPISKTVRFLAVSSILCLLISSSGPFMLSYLFAIKSLNAILYKDALYTYLHFQYNGFFTLSVFALLFQKLESKITQATKKNVHQFAILLTASIIPSQFLSYLWTGPNGLFWVIAIIGSVLLILSLIWFIISAASIAKAVKSLPPVTRCIGTLSMFAFMLKLFLQSFTIFPLVGNAVFGDRPIIIGFLHLVFLGFVSLFILAYYSQKGFLNIRNYFTRVALFVFAGAVVGNEVVLMSQGLGAMFIESSTLVSSLLWIISIFLFAGALLIAIARFKFSRETSRHSE